MEFIWFIELVENAELEMFVLINSYLARKYQGETTNFKLKSKCGKLRFFLLYKILYHQLKWCV